MDVRSRRHPGNRRPKCRERNAVLLEIVDQCLAFSAIGIQRDVHRVPMIQTPLIVDCSLAKDCDW